jgi:predicted acyltransferase
MVFYTISCRIGRPLPDILQHNVAGSVHFGDFVLPFFLFASGMSLVFFHEKRKKKKGSDYALDVIERFGKLALVSFLLSPFMTGSILQMEEVMLSAILFLACIVVVSLPEAALLLLSLLVFALYFMNLWAIPDPSLVYLGGYAAAPFYLPVMLFGLMAGRRMNEKKGMGQLIAVATLLAIALLALVPADKMSVTPSFMALSVLVSLALYSAVDALLGKSASGAFWAQLEYLGQRPIRYWVLMFVLVVAPISFYALATTDELPLAVPWEAGVLFAVGCIPALYLVSVLIDRIKGMRASGAF